MSNKEKIYNELRRYKRSFWRARLIQGLFIFSGTGIVLAVIVSLVEYTAWLTMNERMVLFFICLIIEVLLFGYYIIWPGFQVLVNGKALSDWKAANLIGSKLEEVDDRLTNFLELDKAATGGELIDASLEQKGGLLLKQQFGRSFDYSVLRPYMLFLVPLLAMVAFIWQGNRWYMIEEGAIRLVYYNQEFERDLPFDISISGEFVVEEGEDFVAEINLSGAFIPEQIELLLNDRSQRIPIKSGISEIRIKECYEDFSFRFAYDEIIGESFSVEVSKKAVIGRVTVKVAPPPYTGITPFVIQNSNKIEVPEGSALSISYAFKNTQTLEVEMEDATREKDIFFVENQQELKQIISTPVTTIARSKQKVLHELEIGLIKDKRPNLSVTIDSTNEDFIIRINANDDYSIVWAKAIFEGMTGVKEQISLNPKGNILKRNLTLTQQELERLNAVDIVVSDERFSVSKRIELSLFKESDLSQETLLENAGNEISKMTNENQLEDDSLGQKQKSDKEKKEELKEQADQLNKTIEKLTEKDSVQFNQLDKLSKEIQQLLEKMEKEIPESQKRISEKKLEEKLAALEKEWMILKLINDLTNVQDSLKNNEFVDEESMKQMQEESNKLQDKLNDEEKKNVDWEKFKELNDNNKELKQGSQKTDKHEKEKKQEGNQEEENNQPNDKKVGDEMESSPKEEDLKEQMREDSEELKEQLGAMSSMMMMESMQANIELIRRLELRALKASKSQEEVYKKTVNNQEYDKKVILEQTEIKNSATNVLDSLSALTVSDPMLGTVLNENRELLAEHLVELKGMHEMPAGQLTTKQRYLQYSLNDLASILYDILKSESEQMMSMMSGNKACNKPKSGKGKKESLSQQQKTLGEKMGRKQKPGKGKEGKQTLSEGELLELIKGQEHILEQYQQQQKQKGGQKVGDGEVIDQMNKQLDDLINNNIDKAIERNKDIEDKLITIEQSENKKKEDDNKRKSKQNEIDYDSIRRSSMHDYLRNNQSGTGVVNLPALKVYYSGKWVIINQ